MRVADMMTFEPTVIGPENRLRQAAEEMALGQIHHMPVVDRHGRLLGILSHRDVVAAGNSPNSRVSDIMIRDVKTVTPEVEAHEAAYLLLRYAIGSVPVLDDDGVLVGIVTESDFVRVAYQLLGGRVPVDQIELEELEAERV